MTGSTKRFIPEGFSYLSERGQHMRFITKAKVGIGTAGVMALAASLIAPAAYADYAPSKNDVVGVGSDTVQFAVDFLADGDFLSDNGYNFAGNKNKLVNFDATPDANARLAYGAQGLGPSCSPGTGVTNGTGNQNTNHTEAAGNPVCYLNPTVVLRGGRQPVTRQNGSGAGRNALQADSVAPFQIDFGRSSSAYGAGIANPGGVPKYNSVTLGTDGLAMLSSTTTNAVALSASQLALIYTCAGTGTGGAVLWNDPRIGGSSSAAVKPLLPQVGSGTRSSFLSGIGVATPGTTCGISNVEENDPEAIDQSGDSLNAIEPMSSGRLNLYLGKLGDGTANGVGGYFKDPSCLFTNASQSVNCTGAAATLAPNVRYWNQGTDVPSGTPAPGALFNISRNLYMYYRTSDLNSTKKFQPGNALNWVRTLLDNPCSGPIGTAGCAVVDGINYGPGGQPYIAGSAGQALISAAGIAPTYATTVGGP